jgi:non-specific serine/threonine protein kinase/serine/threonine-protein kinase
VSDAWARPAAERDQFTLEECGGDAALRAEVLSLLESMEQAGERFETPALAMPASRVAAADALHTSVIEPGERVGPWTVVRLLGSGGMGTVYLAERVGDAFRQRAALKIVRGPADAILLRRFQDERRILATLDHPHIARLIDGGASERGLPYVAMEYVDGLSMDVYCEQHRLDVRQRLEVFRLVCLAVHYAHQHLVIHRDLKASNILVTADGMPKLLDFGIAKILERDSPADTTRTLFRVFTPENASPEQLRGEPITTATDVYALGLLLYRLITGQGPYPIDTSNHAALSRAVCEDTPVPPSDAMRGATSPGGRRSDADLDRVVLMALRKEPERRYGSAEQFAEDVRRYLEGRPVLAAPDSGLYRGRKFVARNRVAVAAAAGFLLAVGGGIITTSWQARVARQERNRAQREFNAVKGLATSVLGELHDAVVRLPGSLAARELLVRRGTEYLEALRPDAAQDVALRREVAFGYRRLAQLQGESGFPNLGDRTAARRSLEQAAALFESLPEPLDADTAVGLAETYLSLHRSSDNKGPDNTYRAKAEALLTRLLQQAPMNPRVQATAAAFWSAIGNEQEAARDFQRALGSFEKMTSAAAAWVALAPANLDSSRTLSVAYKKVGTEHEMLGRPDDAIALYEKAAALDQDRVQREPARGLWQLDLSFSYGAIGSALAKKGQTALALDRYRQAVELRQLVVKTNPDDDFAKTSLARGHERLASLLGTLGDVEGALTADEARIRVFTERRLAHPDREASWKDEATAIFGAAQRSLDLLDAHRAALHRATAQRVRAMLDRLTILHSDWTRQSHPTGLPPSSQELREALARCERLMASVRSGAAE